MPKVGGVEFPYTKKGMQKAKAWSEMIGKPVKATPMPKKKGQKSKAKPMPRKKGSVAKATPMKYQGGGFAEFSPGDATMTQREALKQEMMSPEYMEQIANLAMGSIGGGGSGGIFKMLKNLLKKPKSSFKSATGKTTQKEGKQIADSIKEFQKKQKADADWAKAKEQMLKAGRKDTPATKKTIRPDVEAVKRGLKSNKPGMTQEELMEMYKQTVGDATVGFAGGGQIPQETLLRAMYALGGEIPAGRRMYGMGKKKKSLQTADVGPVRGMKKGGKVKYHV